jgi:hypothetical protein
LHQNLNEIDMPNIHLMEYICRKIYIVRVAQWKSTGLTIPRSMVRVQ